MAAAAAGLLRQVLCLERAVWFSQHLHDLLSLCRIETFAADVSRAASRSKPRTLDLRFYASHTGLAAMSLTVAMLSHRRDEWRVPAFLTAEDAAVPEKGASANEAWTAEHVYRCAKNRMKSAI